LSNSLSLDVAYTDATMCTTRNSWGIRHTASPRINTLLFLFHDTATSAIYTLSYTTLFRSQNEVGLEGQRAFIVRVVQVQVHGVEDRKSTRLNSSHVSISYAVFCLKKKKYDAQEDDKAKRTARRQGGRHQLGGQRLQAKYRG